MVWKKKQRQVPNEMVWQYQKTGGLGLEKETWKLNKMEGVKSGLYPELDRRRLRMEEEKQIFSWNLKKILQLNS